MENSITDHQQIASKWIEAQTQPVNYLYSIPKLRDVFRKKVELQYSGWQ